MSNELRELLLRIVGDSYQDSLRAVRELRALLAKPAEQPRGEPVAYITVDNPSGRGNEYSFDWAIAAEDLPEGEHKLYTRPAEQPEPISSTSDKYKAELYDEVWQLARDMGFGNVTDALMKLKKQTAPVAEQERRQMIIERYPNVDPLQYEAAVNGLAAAPVAVVLPERKARRDHGLTALDRESDGWNSCLDEVARLNPPRQ
ncbi:hypothetical protein ACFMKY_18110 [Pseudomonas protegens]|uniref:hypothetical protein n=1 Tax=Pseudomonas protegens TaxID=380021 RepID=UPI00366DE730